MILSTSIFAIHVLFTGCNNEPEYDLSQIPIENTTPSQKQEKNSPSPPEEQPPPPDDAPEDGAFEIDDNDCVPPLGQETTLNEANSVTISVNLGPKVLGHELMIDLIQSEHGELQYGVVCKGTSFSFQAPKMLGTVRAAIFIDADHNGPSAKDVQGVTDVFTITDKAISIPSVEWSDRPLSYYNFDEQDDPNAANTPDDRVGDDE